MKRIVLATRYASYFAATQYKTIVLPHATSDAAMWHESPFVPTVICAKRQNNNNNNNKNVQQNRQKQANKTQPQQQMQQSVV